VRKAPNAKGNLEVTIRQFHQTPDRRELSVYAGETRIATRTVSLRAGDNN